MRGSYIMQNSGEKARYDNILNPLLQIYCFMLPFEEALAGAFGSVLKLIGVAIIAYVVVMYRKIILHRYTYPLIIWILLAALSGAWAESFDLWFDFFKIYLSQFVFLLVVIGVEADNINVKGIRKSLIAGAMLASAILIFMPQVSDFTEDGRRTIMLFGHTFDPNIVSAIILLGIMTSLEEAFQAESGKERSFLLFVVVFNFIGIFYTGSRGGLISSVIACSVSLLLEMKKHNNRKFVRKIILFTAIACLVVIPLLPASILETRFSIENILGFNEYTAGAHNRYSIWISSLKLIPERPLLGFGVGNFLQAITRVYFRSCASHNLVILLTIETGLLGLCIFVSYLWSIMKRVKNVALYTTYGLLLGVFVISLTLDSLPYKFFWVTLMYASLEINKKEFSTAL